MNLFQELLDLIAVSPLNMFLSSNQDHLLMTSNASANSQTLLFQLPQMPYALIALFKNAPSNNS